MTVIGYAVCASSLDNGHIGVVHDDGIYLVSAQSLRDGNGYETPSRPGSPRPKYPIGLPALIALLLRAMPGAPSLARDIALGRAVVIGSGVIFLLCSYRWLRLVGVGPWPANAIVLATGFHHVVLVGGSSTIFADVPFAAIVYLLLSRWAKECMNSASRSIVDGFLIGAGLLLRANGISLILAAIVVAWLAPKRWVRVTLVTVGFGIVVLPVWLLTPKGTEVASLSNYGLGMRAVWNSPRAGMAIITRNLAAVGIDLPLHVIVPAASYSRLVARAMTSRPAIPVILKVAVSLLTAYGALRLARSSSRSAAPAWAHAGATICIFAVWPWTNIMDRYFLSLFPMILFAFARGVGEVARTRVLSKIRPRFSHMILYVVCTASLAVGARATWLFHHNGRQWVGASDRKSLDLALERIAILEPNAVIAAHWPETVYLYAGKQAVPLLEDDDLLMGRTGRIDRLKTWMQRTAGRPFYLLVREFDQDTTGFDRAQARALIKDPDIVIFWIESIPDRRYTIWKVSLLR